PGARERLREQREELPARYGARPEAREVRGRQLAVDQAVAPALELAREPDERHLRGVAHTAEHRFAEEGAAERDAVETAGERAVLPGLDRMRVTEAVQLDVSVPHLGRDPGAVLERRPARCRARVDHRLEGRIERD